MTLAAALLLAAACVPDPTYTPTPVGQWDQQFSAGGGGYAPTALYRVFWQKPGDTAWRGSVDLPTWHGREDGEGGPAFYPGRDMPFPIQRVYPTEVQAEQVRIVVYAVSDRGVLGVPTAILDFCAPRLCLPPWHGCN